LNSFDAAYFGIFSSALWYVQMHIKSVIIWNYN